MKMKANGNRTIVTSRGTKAEMKCGLVLPDTVLRKSNVCTDEDGRIVIIKDHHYIELPEGKWLVHNDDLLACIVDGKVIPFEGVIYCRKCEDPDSDVILSTSKRTTQFAEILAAGRRTGVEDYIGWMIYVAEGAEPQPVEDGNDEWLVDVSDVLMAVQGD